jgi:hypothetical protein
MALGTPLQRYAKGGPIPRALSVPEKEVHRKVNGKGRNW